MTAVPPPVPPETHWPSGVGGAQCDDCGATTIVRPFGGLISDMDYEQRWVCLPCWRGDDDEEPTDDC